MPEIVDFPTPPLADETAMTFFTPGMLLFCGNPLCIRGSCGGAPERGSPLVENQINQLDGGTFSKLTRGFSCCKQRNVEKKRGLIATSSDIPWHWRRESKVLCPQRFPRTGTIFIRRSQLFLRAQLRNMHHNDPGDIFGVYHYEVKKVRPQRYVFSRHYLSDHSAMLIGCAIQILTPSRYLTQRRAPAARNPDLNARRMSTRVGSITRL